VTDTKTEKELLDAAKDGMARQIVTYWDHLKFLMGDTNPPVTLAATPPNASDLLAISEEAIKTRKIKLRVIKDGKESDEYFDLKDLDARIDEFKKKHATEPEFVTAITAIEAMGGNISTLVPTYGTLQKTAQAIDQGAGDAGGGLNKAWHFISGAIQWLVGAVQAVFSGKSIPGFWETIAKTAAPDAQGKVKSKLQAVAATDKEVERFLQQRNDSGKSVMDAIASKVHDGTYKALGVPQPEAPASTLPPLDKLKPLGTGVVTPDYFKTGVKNRILAQTTADGKPQLEETIKATLTEGVEKKVKDMGGWKILRRIVPNEQKIAAAAKKMAETMADSIGETLSDLKNKAELEKRKNAPEALARFIAEKIAAEFAKKQGEFVIPLDFTSAKGKERLQQFEDKITEKMASQPNHEMLVKAIGLTGSIKTPESVAATNAPGPEPLRTFNIHGVSHDAGARLPANGGFVGPAKDSPKGAKTTQSPQLGD